jgi:hypothetical protein
MRAALILVKQVAYKNQKIFVHGKIRNFSGYETTFRKHVKNFVFHGHKTEGLQNL